MPHVPLNQIERVGRFLALLPKLIDQRLPDVMLCHFYHLSLLSNTLTRLNGSLEDMSRS